MSEPWEYEQQDAEEKYVESILEEYGPEWADNKNLISYKQAVGEFTADRLCSYYWDNRDLAVPAHRSLAYADSLLASFPKAALVFAVSACELALKNALLKPIVFGLVHVDELAAMVTDLTLQHTGMERFQSLLAEILRTFGGFDLKTYQRDGSHRTLWQEIIEVQRARNEVVHKGKDPDPDHPRLAVEVATTLLTQIFPAVVRSVGMYVRPSDLGEPLIHPY